jgi:ABC-2 type transport system ATP-binding protein
MDEYIVETKNLSKKYDTVYALDHVNISIKRGEIYGLVGENGAGKTTFLKLLAGQIFPSEGEFHLFGKYLTGDVEKMRKRQGVLIENAGFYPELSVEKNLEYFRIQKGIADKKVIDEVLELTDLTENRKKAGKQLSLGMKQRLGLAIALLGIPEFLMLDEPVNGLDPMGIIAMRKLLLRLNKEKNITILLSSHILSEQEQLATVYGFLQRGHLIEQVSAENLKKKCADYIEIKVSDPETYVTLLERRLNHMNYRVMPEGDIQILEPKDEINVYSNLASGSGLEILKLERRRQSLEEYYVNLRKDGE